MAGRVQTALYGWPLTGIAVIVAVQPLLSQVDTPLVSVLVEPNDPRPTTTSSTLYRLKLPLFNSSGCCVCDVSLSFQPVAASGSQRILSSVHMHMRMPRSPLTQTQYLVCLLCHCEDGPSPHSLSNYFALGFRIYLHCTTRRSSPPSSGGGELVLGEHCLINCSPRGAAGTSA